MLREPEGVEVKTLPQVPAVFRFSRKCPPDTAAKFRGEGVPGAFAALAKRPGEGGRGVSVRNAGRRPVGTASGDWDDTAGEGHTGAFVTGVTSYLSGP